MAGLGCRSSLLLQVKNLQVLDVGSFVIQLDLDTQYPILDNFSLQILGSSQTTFGRPLKNVFGLAVLSARNSRNVESCEMYSLTISSVVWRAARIVADRWKPFRETM